MNSTVQVVAICVSLGLVGLVVELVRRRMLVEEYSVVWLLGAICLLLLSLFRNGLHTCARWLGIDYPPSLLLLVLFFFVFIGMLSVSVVVSTQRAQIRRLFEEVAIVTARVRELERAAATTPPDRSDAARDLAPPG